MRVTVYILQAFCEEGRGGNPAGVVLDADPLDSNQKLLVAKQVGLSETAFVSRSEVASLKLEFFTPTRQIPHCGHATVAAFALCRQLNRLSDGRYTKESIDGLRHVRLSTDQVTLEQPYPSFSQIEAGSPLGVRCLEAVSASANMLASNAQLTLARAGNAFLLMPFASEDFLVALTPNHREIISISEELDLVGLYPYCRAVTRPARTASTRMFAPRFGIGEESATGTAAGPLGALLLAQSAAHTRCLIEQGHFMHPSSPSTLAVSLAESSSEAPPLVLVSGAARGVGTLEVEA